MNNTTTDSRKALLRSMSRFNSAFSRGEGSPIAACFAEDGRLMWPSMEDIVGRGAIAKAFGDFFREFAAGHFAPDLQTIEVCGNRAFAIGRFIEDLQPRAGGPAERVYGRVVEAWRQTSGGDWELTTLLTSRYGENETAVTST